MTKRKTKGDEEFKPGGWATSNQLDVLYDRCHDSIERDILRLIVRGTWGWHGCEWYQETAGQMAAKLGCNEWTIRQKTKRKENAGIICRRHAHDKRGRYVGYAYSVNPAICPRPISETDNGWIRVRFPNLKRGQATVCQSRNGGRPRFETGAGPDTYIPTVCTSTTETGCTDVQPSGWLSRSAGMVASGAADTDLLVASLLEIGVDTEYKARRLAQKHPEGVAGWLTYHAQLQSIAAETGALPWLPKKQGPGHIFDALKRDEYPHADWWQIAWPGHEDGLGAFLRDCAGRHKNSDYSLQLPSRQELCNDIVPFVRDFAENGWGIDELDALISLSRDDLPGTEADGLALAVAREWPGRCAWFERNLKRYQTGDTEKRARLRAGCPKSRYVKERRQERKDTDARFLAEEENAPPPPATAEATESETSPPTLLVADASALIDRLLKDKQKGVDKKKRCREQAEALLDHDPPTP